MVIAAAAAVGRQTAIQVAANRGLLMVCLGREKGQMEEEGEEEGKEAEQQEDLKAGVYQIHLSS